MNFLTFVENPNNSLWIDLGFLIFILLVLVVLYFLRPFYFHYLGSTLFIGFGISLLVWPLINKELNVWYDQLLQQSSSSVAIKEFVLYLKFNIFISKLLFFTSALLAFFLLTNLFYFALFRRKFVAYYATPGKKLLISNIIIKFFVFLALIGITTYFATPFYIISTKDQTVFVKQKNKSYLNAVFNQFKIAEKYTNFNNNSLQPIWNDLVQLQNKETITPKAFTTSLTKVNQFFNEKFNYFYQNKWLKTEVKNLILVKDLLKPAFLKQQLANANDFNQLKSGFRNIFANYSDSYFVLLPKIA